MCGCTGRGVVGDEEGADTNGDEDSSDSAASLSSVGSIAEESAESVDEGVSSDDAADTSIDDGPPPEDQEWLLAIATFLDPDHPLQWHVIVDYEDGELIELRLQSLSLDMGSTTAPRQLVGNVTVTDDLTVDDAGNFELVIAHLVVPGEANPITASEIVAEDVRLTGTGMLGSSCGTVEGMVQAPIMTALTGSTFAARPITSVDDLPLEFPVACE